jgi:hypothetical protein
LIEIKPYLTRGYGKWQLIIKFARNAAPKILLYGSNAFPKEWDMFCSLIEVFVGRPFA